jgi:hypothetical protein
LPIGGVNLRFYACLSKFLRSGDLTLMPRPTPAITPASICSCMTDRQIPKSQQIMFRGISVALAGFAVVHARSDGEAHTVDAPLIHCFDGKQVVLAFVSRTALADYFRLRRRPTMRESTLVVDRNLAAFARIVTAKYKCGTTSIYDGFGQSFPRVDVTFEDMQHSGEKFTADVLRLQEAFHQTAA